ncbi:SDR family NAD(P)-dependent oxidoreductase [Ktedonospora formicarum]|uniref:Short-chain dehydrogenase n=1 Tax=Ktedonospora formicarum TaxID=2778364 RepID=A0A8J3IBV8_9CHLR|nr:SDR family NAD(P)-dependent oxidoreductase [Ktedonospora formicarum]GHO50430.1 short-chain dehydrogenase [Ktedonospora formicarum]
MKEFQSKVAVVTGAASGIGQALAQKSASLGMKVVLADVEESALKRVAEELKMSGAQVLAVQTDVSKASDVQRLAELTFQTYGEVHLLFNNAGVSAGSTVWESSLADWQWVVGVNLWGVIHGVHAFLPPMLAQNSEGHIINTASMAGLVSSPGGIYPVTKHAIVALSETLFHELTLTEAKIKVSVLCPGFVNTRILDAARNRPLNLQNASVQREASPQEEAMLQFMRQAIQSGMPPFHIADIVFKAIRDEKFYILTHPEWKESVRSRMDDLLQERNPTFLPVREA